MEVKSEKSKPLKGEIIIPADKSITHRAFLFSALTKGVCRVENCSLAQDCFSTLKIIENLGCEINRTSEKNIIINAKKALKAPLNALDCGNSGTTTRLIMGILAGQKFNTKLIGDESLSKRPMKRVIEPLELMGASFNHNNYKLPLEIQGGELTGIDYISKLSSAQVKSCIMLSGLFADGKTSISEPYKSRNHTELMFKYMGADIVDDGLTVTVKKSQLNPVDIVVAGDISSAAFFITAALIIEGSDILIKNVGVNETRTGIIDVYKKMGADIELLNERIISNEKVADIRVKYGKLKGVIIEGEIIPRLIDEIPIIALAATQAEGTTIIKDAQDLRNKEADRIKAVQLELSKLGAKIEEMEDGLIIEGKTMLEGGVELECHHDHRIAMSEYIAGLICKNPVIIKEFEWVNISFPEFLKLFGTLK